MENEEQELEQAPQVIEPEKKYVPRPAWQVWAARIGVAIMVICVILYLWHIASGGMK